MRSFLFALPLLFIINLSAAAPRSLPPPPPSFVYDEAKVLDAKTLEALQTLFKAQERSTGDQVVFAVFKSLEGEDIAQWTNRIFHFWKIGQKGKDNGILLAVYWADHKARIEVGYGLEPKLTDAKSKRILAEILAPNLRQNLPDQALTQAALEILKIIESPLIQNGQAIAILNGAHLSHQAQPVPASGPARFVWVVLSFFLILIFGRAFWYRGDRGFERNNWHPSDPLSYRRRRGSSFPDDTGFGGGGFGGGSGGSSEGGGDSNDFGGGGGDSGGGGASGDW